MTAKGGENMSDREKKAADELIESLRSVPADAEDYVRGYIQGRVDGLKNKDDEENIPA